MITHNGMVEKLTIFAWNKKFIFRKNEKCKNKMTIEKLIISYDM